MTYFDYPNLQNFIVINPTCLIDVLKSIVTSVPSIASLQQGRLTKSDLTTIWSSEKLSHFLQHEEYFRQLLVHFDILSEMRRYDTESGKKIPVASFIVPCMITHQNTTTFCDRHITSRKCIGFVFEFRASFVPDAIPNRLIASVLSSWNVKRFENVDLLFSGFVVVVLDRKHDLVVKTDRNRVAVYIVHRERKELIIKDLASCLRSGCLSANCLLAAEKLDAIEVTWMCDNHGYNTPKSELDIWFTDRTILRCTESCQGIQDKDLPLLLSESQLLQICNSLTGEEVRCLSVHLGASNSELDDIVNHHTYMQKFYSLHLPDRILNLSPSDEMLDKLCLRIGKEWMVLGVELGLEIERLEQIEYENPKLLSDVSRQMLYSWRKGIMMQQ
ncbi:unnamed protein product [Mytilus edulis]|uniref:Death domain-containing protein n=1 Tax=Mytilus edulis TaxID=6550 RepID=A0A8S3Q9M3_MYTED|nr:unnamed protein product [Mytilus edulis]